MNSIINLIRREPVAVAGFVSALISLAAAFGLQLSAEQTGAVMAIVPALSALVVRGQVTPTNVVPHG